MSGHTSFWEEVHHQFDPDRPVPVNEPHLHVARKREYNALVTIERKLSAPTRDYHRFLLTGAMGNGKSSELNAFTNRLARSRLVVSFDLWNHLQGAIGDPKAINRLLTWELLGLIGLAMIQAGQALLGHTWKDEPKALEQALEQLRDPEAHDSALSLDIGQLAAGMTVVAGGAAGAALAGPVGAAAGKLAADATVGAVKTVAGAARWRSWKLGLRGAKDRDDQDGEVRAVFHAVNRLIDGLQTAYSKRVLLVIDGPDRITDGDRAEALFVNSSLLGTLPCDVLMTAPLALMRHLGTRVEPFKLRDLSNLPVLDRDEPNNPDELGPGVPFFRELVAQRLAHIRAEIARGTFETMDTPADPLPEPIIDRLAYYSGGLVRDFVTMVRAVALEAMLDGREQVDDAIVDTVLRERRGAREFYMDKDQITLLEAVMADPLHALPGEQLAIDLLLQKRLIAYPNNTPWYYPHPLLTLALLGRSG